MNIKNLFKNIAKQLYPLLQKVKALEYQMGLIADYVVEVYNGTNEGYTKWESGKCEIWKRIYKNINSTAAWSGGIYFGTYTDNSITYTMNGFTGFIEHPSAQVTIRSTSGNIFSTVGYHYANGADPTTSYGTYYVYSVGSVTNCGCTFQLYAVGKWK